MVFFESTVLPLPSFELCVSVVLNVWGAGVTTAGTAKVVDNVVLEDVVCAKALLVIRNKAHVLAATYFFIVILHHSSRNTGARRRICNAGPLIPIQEMGNICQARQVRKLRMLKKLSAGAVLAGLVRSRACQPRICKHACTCPRTLESLGHDLFRRASFLVAGPGFEPGTFRL